MVATTPDSRFTRTGVPRVGWNTPKNRGKVPSAPAMAWIRSEAIIQALPWLSRTKMNSAAVTCSSTCAAGP